MNPETKAQQEKPPPLALVSMDTVGPAGEDVLGNGLLLTTRDIGSWAKSEMPLLDMTATTVAAAFTPIYPDG